LASCAPSSGRRGIGRSKGGHPCLTLGCVPQLEVEGAVQSGRQDLVHRTRSPRRALRPEAIRVALFPRGTVSAWHCFRVALLPLARRSRHFSAQFDVLDRVLADEGARHALCASVHITYPLEKLIYLSPISHLIALP
jgi:hypothetical protein